MDLSDPKTGERLREDLERREREVRSQIFDLSKTDTTENREAILHLMQRHYIKHAIQWLTNVINEGN